jgi:hypothetical protein
VYENAHSKSFVGYRWSLPELQYFIKILVDSIGVVAEARVGSQSIIILYCGAQGLEWAQTGRPGKSYPK